MLQISLTGAHKINSIRLAELSLVAAIFFIGFRTKDFMPIPYFYLADIMLVSSGVFTILSREFRSLARDYFKKVLPYLVLLGGVGAFIMLGQALSFARFEADPTSSEVLVDYSRLIFNFCAFFGAAFLIYRNPKIIKLVSGAVIASFVLVLPVYFMTENQEVFFSAARLAGLLKNSLVFGALAAIAITLCFGVVLRSLRFWKKAVMIVWLAFIMAFIFWSGARTAWISVAAATFLFVTFLFRKKEWRKLKVFLVVFVFVFVGGYFLIGDNHKYNVPDDKMRSYLKSRSTELVTSPTPYYKDRVIFWVRDSVQASTFPFGFGFLDLEKKNHYPGFTGTFFEVMTYGGLQAVVLFAVFLVRMVFQARGLAKRMMTEDLDLVLFSWLVAGVVILINITTFNFFLVRVFWLLLGVVAGMILNEISKHNFQEKNDLIEVRDGRWVSK